jgi:hypothetical protein
MYVLYNNIFSGAKISAKIISRSKEPGRQSGEESQDRTVRIGKPKKDIQATAGRDSQNRTARKGKPGMESWERDSQERIVRAGQPGQDSQTRKPKGDN